MLNNFFINRNENLIKLYSYNAKDHPENHYGTFEQFFQVLQSFRAKKGFDLKIENHPYQSGKIACFPFTVKTEEGTEIDFAENLRIKITIDRKREDPLDLGEPIWWVNKDGTRTQVGAKKRNTRVFEYFVFSSLKEFYKFVRWTNALREANGLIHNRFEKDQKEHLDVKFNYWNLDKEAKKIYNMKEKEMDKLLETNGHEDEFKMLARAERVLLTDRR